MTQRLGWNRTNKRALDTTAPGPAGRAQWRWVASLAPLPAVAACALATATPPGVEVAQVQLRGADVLNQVLDVSLCVTNPNDTELSFRRVRVMLDVSGTPLADSESASPVRLPPHSSTLVPFSVVTTTRNLGPQLLGIVQTGNLAYRVHGTIQLAGSLGITLPFSRSGRLDVLSAGNAVLADAMGPGGTACRPTGIRS